MKQLFVLTLTAILFAATARASEPANGKSVYSIDVEKSKVHWLGKKVTGEHTGTISFYDGEVVYEDEKPVSANVKMDMNTIVCTDLTNEQWNQKLVGHLKSDDFFSVEKHPESVFKATGFKAMQADADGINYQISGNLTIKGITHEISFPAKVEVSNSGLMALGVAKIDRTKYDIKYRSGSFFQDLGDNLIYDEFEITFELVAHVGEAN